MPRKVQWKEDLKHPWVLALIGIISASVLANLIMGLAAIWSNPGLVARNYYEKGQNYFHTEAKRQRELAKKWRLYLMAPDTPRVGQEQIYRLYFMTAEGAPASQGAATLFAYRPSDAGKDFQIPLSYADIGTFAAPIRFPEHGKWDLIGQVEIDGQRVDVAQRIFVED